jgi:hypothetical protein
MTTTFVHAARIPAFGAAPANPVQPARASRYQWVDALVTFAAVAWFTAALAGMVGEWHGAPSAPAAATGGMPAPLPQASASQGDTAHPRMRLI